MRIFRRLLPLAGLPLMAVGSLPAATTAEGVLIRRQPTVPVRLRVEDLAAVDIARFYVTADRGMTWTMAEEVDIERTATEPPVFRFVAEVDGIYGFATATVAHDGSAEAPPVDGATIPDKGSMVVIDTTAPSIERFAVARKQGQQLTVAWGSTDPHLLAQPATIELRPDGADAWQELVTGLPATGTRDVTVVGPAELRVVVRDRAGNASASPPWTVPAGTAAEETGDLQEAIAALPSVEQEPTAEVAEGSDPDAMEEAAGDPVADAVAELPELPKPPTQETAAAESAEPPPAADGADDEAVATAGADEATASPPAEPVAAVDRPVVPPDHQDIVAPHADSWSPPPRLSPRQPVEIIAPVGEDLSAPGSAPDIDRQFDALAQGGEPRTTFSGEPSGVVNTGRSSWRSSRPVAVRDHAGITGSSPSARVLASLSRGALLDADAARAQEAAREARAAREVDTALALYRRLRDSRLAADTIVEEVAYYHELGRSDEAIRVASSAPPEARSDALACLQARILLDQGEARRAERSLLMVDIHGPHYRESQLLSARALLALDKPDQARAVLRALAAGSDRWAKEASELLAGAQP